MSTYPEQLEPGIYGQTDPGNIYQITNGLASGIATGQLAAGVAGLAPGLYGTLKGLGEAGEAALGGTPEAIAGAKAVSKGLQDIEVYIKGIQKIGDAQEPIYGVRGPAEKLLAEFGDADPGSVPEHILRQKGLLPSAVPESQNHTAPFAHDLRELWADMAKEQSGTPIKVY